jgi:hypothetical protein
MRLETNENGYQTKKTRPGDWHGEGRLHKIEGPVSLDRLQGWHRRDALTSICRSEERNIPMRSHYGVMLMWVLSGSVVSAQDWARRMFDHTQHDFGVVASGTRPEHRFPIENIYKEEAHILSVISNCGCTNPTPTKTTLKTLEKAELIATVDTRNFSGQKDVAIKVRFDRPFPAEVILNVSCHIRGDVVMQPGTIDFGSVNQGTAVERRASLVYAGRPGWKIIAVEVNNSHLHVQLTESGRGEGKVTYDLVVALKNDTPSGYIKDQLVLLTNDLNSRTGRVPVAVEGLVMPGITVRPSPLVMGVVTIGDRVTRQLVAQSVKPFRVLNVECADARFRFDVPSGAKTLHLIPVTFAADRASGNVTQTIHVRTDGAGGVMLDVPVTMQVVPEPTRPKS